MSNNLRERLYTLWLESGLYSDDELSAISGFSDKLVEALVEKSTTKSAFAYSIKNDRSFARFDVNGKICLDKTVDDLLRHRKIF